MKHIFYCEMKSTRGRLWRKAEAFEMEDRILINLLKLPVQPPTILNLGFQIIARARARAHTCTCTCTCMCYDLKSQVKLCMGLYVPWRGTHALPFESGMIDVCCAKLRINNGVSQYTYLVFFGTCLVSNPSAPVRAISVRCTVCAQGRCKPALRV